LKHTVIKEIQNQLHTCKDSLKENNGIQLALTNG